VKDYYIGIDAGTSLIKAVAFDGRGNEIAKETASFSPSDPHPQWIEGDMSAIWLCVEGCLSKLCGELAVSEYKLGGIGITSTGDGTWLINARGEPVRPGIFWCDGRAGEIVDEWYRTGLAERAFARCGTAVFTGSQAVQIKWLETWEPSSLEQAAVIFHEKDWLFYKLTGHICSDDTDESLTMIDLNTRGYDEELFGIFGIEKWRRKYPELRRCGKAMAEMRPEIAVELKLPAGVMVSSGPMDVVAAAVGSGAILPGDGSSILGTAGINQLVMGEVNTHPRLVGMTLAHALADRWIRMIAAMIATPNVDWAVRQLGLADSSFEDLEVEMSKIEPGSNGILYHPYLFPGGERGPFVKPNAKASFFGLSENHTKMHILRSVYEGVALSMLDCYRHMPKWLDRLYLSGGGAKSRFWCQMISDVLGTKVIVPKGSEYGALGAVITLCVAQGMFADYSMAVKAMVGAKEEFSPNPRATVMYNRYYELYKAVRQSNMTLWDRREEILRTE
jgi:sugar (pentulose or hexulose) kinase